MKEKQETGHRFNYHRDKRTRRRTIIQSLFILLVVGLLVYFAESSYVRAWFVAISVAIVGLYVLSIPRCILVTPKVLEIRCVVELTRIPISEISFIRKIRREEMKRIVPLLGSYGFFGYYGYYFDLKRWGMVKVYAGEWNNMVEIEDIFEERYYVSCRNADSLIQLIEANKSKIG